MRVVESKSTLLVSRLIRWVFNSKGSHIFFSFDNDKWVVHSNFIGVNIRLYENYIKKITEVDSISYDLDLQDEEEVFQSLIKQTSENEYDWAGFAYFACRALLFKLFGVAMPKVNKWGKADMDLCTEMVARLPKGLTRLPEGVDLGITTPDRVMQILREAK